MSISPRHLAAPSEPEGTPTTAACEALREVATALSSATEAVVRPVGLSVAQYSCLDLLRRRPGSSGADVARASGVTRQSSQVLLRAMERDGLVEQGHSPGRAFAWTITAHGEQRLEEAAAAVRRVDAAALDALDGDQRADLAALLRLCAAGLHPAVGPAPDLTPVPGARRVAISDVRCPGVASEP